MILSTSYQMGTYIPLCAKHSLKPGMSNIPSKVVKTALAKDGEYGIMLTIYSSTRQDKTKF